MWKARSIKAACSLRDFPVVIAREKDGLLRFCVDYRALNKHIKDKKFPISAVEEVIESMDGGKVFQKLTCLLGTGSYSLQNTYRRSLHTHVSTDRSSSWSCPLEL